MSQESHVKVCLGWMDQWTTYPAELSSGLAPSTASSKKAIAVMRPEPKCRSAKPQVLT